MKKCLSLFLCAGWLSSTLSAQQVNLDDEQKGFSHLTQQGKLFQATLAPAGKEMQLSVAGVEGAKLKSDATTVEVTYGLGEKKSKLVVRSAVDPKTGKKVYLIQRVEEPLENLEIHVRAGSDSERLVFPKVP